MKILGKLSVAWWLKWPINLSWGILGLILIVLVLQTLYALLTSNFSGIDSELSVRFELDPEAYRISSSAMGIESAEITNAVGKLKIADPSPGYALALRFWDFLTLGIAFVIVGSLRGIFVDLAAGRPFAPSSARRLRTMGAVILGGQFAGAAMGFTLGNRLEAALATEGLTLTPDFGFNLGAIFLALVILVIAEVFRLGAELKRDQDLTI